MSKMSEIDRLCNEIANELAIHPEMVNLSQVSEGWLADVHHCGLIIEFTDSDDAFKALEGLLEKCKKRKVS